MKKAKLYDRYPLSSILTYNGITVLHFLVGGVVLFSTVRFFGVWGGVLGLSYASFSFIEMYVMMPLQVCRNCVYVRLENGMCISGLNVIARKVEKKGDASDFPKRAQGLFCPNNLYILSLVFPILAGIPILVLNYSNSLLCLEILLFMLLAARFLYVIPQLVCVHCRSKFVCPQAGQMGVREK